jgi:hypothetical protein
MRSLFAVIKSLVLPAGAIPGQPRIVLGSDIPTELTTYYNVGLARITSAILWYYGNATNTYHYYAVVDLGGGAPPGNVVRGDVLTGTVFPLDIYVGNDYYIKRTVSSHTFNDRTQITDDVGFTHTTYATNQSCGVTFVAPASGTLIILYNAIMQSNTAGVRILISPEVREGLVIGAGTLKFSANDARAIITPLGDYIGAGSYRPITGLTPDTNYNVQLLYKLSGAGNGTIFNQEVMPLPWIGSAALT